ncbi:MAG: NYN domain-containing protein, partial [Planctomycetes bacterium]|nr:NYN domain-containing protein [Planctomycetota bacterium]
MPVIIDGYNLLRSIPNDESSNSVDDVQLCRILGEYLTVVSETGQIIFDGIGPPDKTGFDNIRNLEVFFSGQSLEADDVIEDKLKLNTAPKRLMVVSSDRRLRKAAMARKAI